AKMTGGLARNLLLTCKGKALRILTAKHLLASGTHKLLSPLRFDQVLSYSCSGKSKLPGIFTYPCCRRACVESVFWVMPLTKLVADALGVVTISLVAVLGLIGLLCIIYSFYFRSHIRSQGYNRLGYFGGPWVIRIIFILFSIWWGFGEILRLEFLRQEGRVLHTLNLKWQDIVCKCYIMSNLGFAEPCLFLSLVFLLRASLQKTESGPLSKNWNFKTAIYVLLCSFPMFALQMTVVLVGPHYKTDLQTNKYGYFFKFTSDYQNDVARCYYPLMSTIFLGVFATVLTLYLFWLGRRILSLPGDTVFEVLAFMAFLSLLCCAVIDKRIEKSIEEYNDTLSLIANQSPLDEVSGRNSVASAKQGSISFRTMERDDLEHSGAFVELSLFAPSQHSTPIGSPQLMGWPRLPSATP
ncbi:hypothetical protein Tco_0232697, partial [Tanacetum coccineum]